MSWDGIESWTLHTGAKRRDWKEGIGREKGKECTIRRLEGETEKV